jgi:hypothetical protein
MHARKNNPARIKLDWLSIQREQLRFVSKRFTLSTYRSRWVYRAVWVINIIPPSPIPLACCQNIKIDTSDSFARASRVIAVWNLIVSLRMWAANWTFPLQLRKH